MPMNLDAVGAVSQPGRNSWTSKDALLYALGVGAGQTDPTGFELEFTTENTSGVDQRVLPTMPVVIAMVIISQLLQATGLAEAAPLATTFIVDALGYAATAIMLVPIALAFRELSGWSGPPAVTRQGA